MGKIQSRFEYYTFKCGIGAGAGVGNGSDNEIEGGDDNEGEPINMYNSDGARVDTDDYD